MSRKWVAGLVVTGMLFWGGSAMAQINSEECQFTGDTNHLLTFPYLTNSDGWWGGMAVINTSGTDIGNDSLCLVGITEEGQTITKSAGEVGADVPGNGMLVALSDIVSADRVAIGVFTNANVTTEQVRGFGMIGDFTQGQGYLALQGDLKAGSTYLEVPYVPEGDTGWWRGFALFNNSGEQQEVTISVYFADGTEGEWDNITLEPNQMEVTLAPDWNQRARIVMQADGHIMGFAMFGDNAQAQGLVLPSGPAPEMD